MYPISNSRWSAPLAASNASPQRSFNRLSSGALNELPHAETEGADLTVNFSATSRRFAKMRMQRQAGFFQDADRIATDDTAEESTEFARRSMLLESRTALLAQANLSDESALHLLD